MTDTRELTIRLNAGTAEDQHLGEIHLIIATHNPREGARDVFRAITLVAPSDVASDQPTPFDAYLLLLHEAQTAIERTVREHKAGKEHQ